MGVCGFVADFLRTKISRRIDGDILAAFLTRSVTSTPTVQLLWPTLRRAQSPTGRWEELRLRQHAKLATRPGKMRREPI
jgi:hypothetical protein